MAALLNKDFYRREMRGRSLNPLGVQKRSISMPFAFIGGAL